MDQETPKCFLGCCDVRRFTQFYTIFAIVLSTLLLMFGSVLLFFLGFLLFDASYKIKNKDKDYIIGIKALIFQVILFCKCYIFFLYFSIKLRKTVTNYDPAPIKNYLILILILMGLSILGVCINMLIPDSKKPKVIKDDCDSVSYNTIIAIVLGLIIIVNAVCNYPVYQYYKCVKSRQGNTQERSYT